MALEHPDHWIRLDELFQGALQLPRSERAAYLARACDGDLALRSEVEDMLSADEADIDLLATGAAPGALDPDPFLGSRLGPWLVLEIIGRGGMGTVYRARRDDGEYEQQVALKIVRSPVQAQRADLRFRAEAHILARLSHPNIARLVDAGLTPERSPYLVMEHVDGCPVTEYCDGRRLTIDERLRIFLTVAHATQHAHQSLVVHRDLKPSNIFVSRTGEVKLLDFGIAKLLERNHPLADETAPELRVLTPAYAAPEQLGGEPVTTATDVYVLGVVLYELLTGSRPALSDADAGIAPARRLLPAAPSAAIRRMQQSPDTEVARAVGLAAANRQTTPRGLARRLDGDIDRVVLKALQPEAGRRYGSAGMLADDIQRLIDGRPVSAQPDSVAYRVRRFVGRHRTGVAMTAIVLISIVVSAIVAIMQARAIAVERDRAQLEAARAARVSALVADLFRMAEPGAAAGQDLTARQLLDRGASRIAAQLAGDPPIQAALFNVVGRLYSNLSLHEAAIQVLQQALELERKEQPRGSLTQAETLHWLGELHVRKSDYAAAEPIFRQALDLRRSLGAPASDIAATLEALGRGLSFEGRDREARIPLQEAVDIRRRDPGQPAPLMSALNELAVATHRLAEMVPAEALFREAADVGRRVTGPSPEKVDSLLHHARLVQQFDRNPSGAEPVFRDALAMARAIYPDDHQQTATIMDEFARNRRDLGRLDEAETLARDARAMFTRVYGTRHREVMVSSQTLAAILQLQRRFADAEPLLRDSLEIATALFEPGHPQILGASRALSTLLDEQIRFAESRALRQQELASAGQKHGPNSVYVALAWAGLGHHGLASGDVAFAETAFLRAVAVRESMKPTTQWRIDETRGLVGVARMRAGRFAAAEADLVAGYEGLRKNRGETAAETLTARRHLVDLYTRWNRPQDADRYRTPPR